MSPLYITHLVLVFEHEMKLFIAQKLCSRLVLLEQLYLVEFDSFALKFQAMK